MIWQLTCVRLFCWRIDTPGTTVLTYTPNGRYIITGGSNSAIRIYTVGQDGEPKTVEEGADGHLGIGATVWHSLGSSHSGLGGCGIGG
jgi:chromosome transmission fidelity protein 4